MDEMEASRKNLEEKNQRFKNVCRRWKEAYESLSIKHSKVLRNDSINKEVLRPLQEYRFRIDSLKKKIDECAQDIRDNLIQINEKSRKILQLSNTPTERQLAELYNSEKGINHRFAVTARHEELLLSEIIQ
ncbi:hypothetical protein NPIL_73701 [Nephila pilipes]|uniref:Uncharacterized protein n=1 Tax=Nephila pilipes TaxID=299642 RepID=A0A8X6IE34_NEPPI|nr:hypothetical protein NPIL_73701 [Nephila pilipes]